MKIINNNLLEPYSHFIIRKMLSSSVLGLQGWLLQNSCRTLELRYLFQAAVFTLETNKQTINQTNTQALNGVVENYF